MKLWFVVGFLLISVAVVLVNSETTTNDKQQAPKQTKPKIVSKDSEIPKEQNRSKTDGTKPVKLKKTSDSKTTETKPTESKKFTNSKTTDTKPTETKKSSDPKTTQTKSAETKKSLNSKTTETKPTETKKSSDSKTAETKKSSDSKKTSNDAKPEPKTTGTKPVTSEKKSESKSTKSEKKPVPKSTESKSSESKTTGTKPVESEKKPEPVVSNSELKDSKSLPPSQIPLSSSLFTINLQKYSESSNHSPLYELNLLIRSLQLEFNLIVQQQQSSRIENSMPERYRTVYRIESYQRQWNPSQPLSGTVNITSWTPLDTILSLDRLLETGSNWTDLEINLSSNNNNKTIEFHAIVGKDASSFDPISKQIYKVSALLKFGKVLFDYRLNVEWQPKRSVDDQNPCPWIQLHHKLTTEPSGLIDFESFVDHSCPDGDQMTIEIQLSSSRWALANFHLKQSFNFGANGDELMKAIHPLFELVISGMWHSSVYSKTFDFKLTDIGQSLLSERMPELFRAVYSRHQLEHENLYTVNIVKSNQNSPALLSSLNRRTGSQPGSINILLPSNLIVIITGSLASTTVIVFSLLGSLLSSGLSTIETAVIRFGSQIELPMEYFTGFPDIDQHYQIVLQITATTFALILVTLLTIRTFPVLFRFFQILVIFLFIACYLLTLVLRLLELFPHYRQTLLLLP